ncbi:MAG: hypothetical protein IIX15_00590 [Clostridia bacterium]|nr:hypothetical protein [Clostridia bacterium]
MEQLRRKLTSRKLWMAIAGFASALIVAFDGSADVAETVTGCIMAGATVIAYIVGEGLIDRVQSRDESAEQQDE